MKTESQMQTSLVKGLKDIGAMVLNLHGHAMQQSGWPDLYIVHWTWKGWIELKKEGGVATPLQKQRLGDLTVRGERAFLVELIERERWVSILIKGSDQSTRERVVQRKFAVTQLSSQEAATRFLEELATIK